MLGRLPRWLWIGTTVVALYLASPWLAAPFRRELPPLDFRSSAPRLLEPENRAVLRHVPRTLELRWEPLQGAELYLVWVEAQDPRTGRWYANPTGSRKVAFEPEATLRFVGPQPGRWRVSAVAEGGVESRSSPWFEFRFEE